MVDSIKITALQDIGANIAYTTLVPVVNMAGTPTTQKSNLQNLGNLILNGAGGSYFPRAAQATLALSVANAAQPNITSVGTLTSLAVTGNITAGNVNGGNIIVANYYYGDGGFLTNVSSGSNYSNSNVAAYLPTYTGNISGDYLTLTHDVTANVVDANFLYGDASNVTNLPVGNIAVINLDGNVANVLHGDGSWSADQTTYSNSNVANYLPTYTGNVRASKIFSDANSGSNLAVAAGGAQWVFGEGGALFWPAPAGNIWAIEPNIDNEFEIKSTNNVVISTDIANTNSHFTFDSAGIFTAPSNVNLLGSRLNVGPDAANAANLLNPTLVIANTGAQYIQAAIINNDANGSSDWSADGAGGGDDEAWTDMGFTGHSFNDANYTITGPGDGYLFVQGYANGIGGHMVLATGDLGAENDIIFATGGFLANNEFARIDHANNLFHLTKANSGIQFADGTIQTTAASGGSYGDSNVTSLLGAFGSNNIVTTGNISANYFVGVATDVSVEAVNNNYSYHMAFVTSSGDTTLHMDDDDNLQYNPADGIMTVNRVDAGYLSVSESVISNLNPFSNVTQDLGNTTNRWKDIWLANSTIHMGDATISANGNSIVVDSISVTNGNVGTIGNIASINLDGSNSNVLYGNGVFAAAPSGGGLPLANGNSNFNIAAVDGNATITANNTSTWTFADTGVLTLPGGNVQIGSMFGSEAILASNIAFGVVTQGNAMSALQWVDDVSNTSQISSIYINDPTGNVGDIQLRTGNVGNANIWVFGNSGIFTLANGNSTIQSVANSSLDPINPNVSTMTLTPDANYNSQALVLDPTAPGHIHLRAPSGTSNIDNPNANLFLGGEESAFEVGVWTGSAPNLFIHSGNNTWTFDNTGNLTVPSSSGGVIKTVANGAIAIAAIDGGSDNPAQVISFNANGTPTTAISSYANQATIQANINGDIKTWAFNNAGNLTLPGNTLAINYANGTAAFGNIVSVNKDGNSSNVLYGNGVFAAAPGGSSYGDSNVTTLLGSFGSNTISTTGNISGGNVTASGTSSNLIRRAFGLVASDVGVTLDDLTVTVSSATSQLTLSTSGSWQGTGWTETFAGGATPTVNSWVNLPLNPGFNNASGAMTSQGNGCRCVISDQTPTAKVYQITVVRSGTSGAQWNISIERLV